MSDIASAPGALDAAFAAVCEILAIEAQVESLEIRYAAGQSSPGQTHGGVPQVVARIVLRVSGTIVHGQAEDADLLHACLAAFIDAAEDVRDDVLTGRDTSIAKRRGMVGGTYRRVFEVRALDENNDSWSFASNDKEAMRAIADEFRREGYSGIACR